MLRTTFLPPPIHSGDDSRQLRLSRLSMARRLRPLRNLFLLTLLLPLAASCYDGGEGTLYDPLTPGQEAALEAHYAESCTLHRTDADSIARFVVKYDAFTRAVPAATAHELHPRIVGNVGAARRALTLGIVIEGDRWEGQTTVNF